MRAFLLLTVICSILLGSDASPGFEYIKDEATTPILNPTLAERKVAKIRLNNGLEAYIISDPGTDQSGASLAVGVGSWSDPQRYPGMAHFCEHMLFMGTKAYPNEAEYMQFIDDHGGSPNAYTASDRTVYTFCINNDAFLEALQRFSHFFIDPLFLSSSVNRELLAVDQEHSKNIENDGWREYMILKETGNPHHPNAGFSTGNAQTLGGIPREALVEWYENNYSANRMHLIVISPLPLEHLVTTVVNNFSPVPERNTAVIAYPFELLSAQQKGHIVYIKPVKNIKKLTLGWQPPKQFAEDREKNVFGLVAYALSYGGADSLVAQLKKENLAESLSAGGQLFSHDEALFEIDISLTEQGVKNLYTVIERCFQAINRLKETGIPAYIFDEQKKMALIDYHYQTRQECFSFVENLSSQVLYEPLSTFPEKQNIPTAYDPALLKAFIDTLVPQTALFFLQANPELTGIPTTAQEKWMHAEYTIKEIPEEELSQWQNASLNPSINIPPKNPFIPQNLALLPPPAPEIIAQDKECLIYFKQDTTYQVPTSTSIFSFRLPLLNGSPEGAALFELYLYSLKQQLYGTLSQADAAGLGFSAFQQDLKVTLSVSGYSDKAPELLKTIFTSLNALHLTQEQFTSYKTTLLTLYQNASKELPLKQGIEILQNLLSNTSPNNASKYAALEKISYNTFTMFCKTAFKKAYVEGMIYGNLAQHSAQELWNDLKLTLRFTPYLIEDQVKKKVLSLPDTGGPFLISSPTEMQGSGMLLSLQEGTFSLEKRGAQQILSTLLGRDFFDALRTKQQTGYIVQSRDSEIEKELFQSFYVQSSSYSPQELLARSEIFLNTFTQTITENLTPARFEDIRSNLLTLLTMPPENQEAMAVRLNLLAFNYNGDFEWIEKRIASLKQLSYDFVIESARSFFAPTNLRRLAILIEGKISPSQTSTQASTNPFTYHSLSPSQLKTLSTYTSK